MLDMLKSRFLSILDVRSQAPSLAALNELLVAFQFTVPFENISKLLSLELPTDKRMPTQESYLDGIEHMQLGGTCLTNNPYFLSLLLALGYHAELKGADMGENRNVHTVIIVTIDGQRFLIDVGFSAPFFEPVPLQHFPVEIKQGPRRYQLNAPEADGRMHMAVFEDENKIHSYDVNPDNFAAEDLGPAITYSFRPGAMFMSCLAITKHFAPGITKTLNNMRLSERSKEGTKVTWFESGDEVARCVRDTLLMPDAPYLRAAEILRERCNVDPFAMDD